MPRIIEAAQRFLSSRKKDTSIRVVSQPVETDAPNNYFREVDAWLYEIIVELNTSEYKNLKASLEQLFTTRGLGRAKRLQKLLEDQGMLLLNQEQEQHFLELQIQKKHTSSDRKLNEQFLDLVSEWLATF